MNQTCKLEIIRQKMQNQSTKAIYPNKRTPRHECRDHDYVTNHRNDKAFKFHVSNICLHDPSPSNNFITVVSMARKQKK